ncbi:hypothetical protein A5717_26170 [Mycolicibacterium porcinum]|uniref:hypothetical protein n=1 Tax=Mycolicibacterium porcinum TaxID=39693 RepID=UPI00080B5A0E|nr:hypothetical protein [Mycolicibacterium porcinum]OCB09264.1 hypothetical protein A5717_26170 [Mycolicibacterium porcinum]
MAQTIVYGCDWCKEIVPKAPDGTPQFARTVTSQKYFATPLDQPKKDKICGECAKVLDAVRNGRFRR